MKGLHFDEANHAYTLDGRKLPGVTTVLKPISSAHYAGVDPAVMEAAAVLGRAVHRMIELDVARDLDLETMHPVLMPYHRGWRNFLATSGLQVLLSEHKLASARMGYAGTFDMFGKLNHVNALIDAKRVALVAPSTGPQTFAYGQLMRECMPELLPAGAPLRRYALQFKKPRPGQDMAPWHLHPFDNDTQDALVWQSCLNISNYLKDKIR